MLRIGICEENSEKREEIRTLLTRTLFKTGEISFVEYADAETLEQEIESKRLPFDLLFLDTKYKVKDGLQLAKQIRSNHLDVDIVFVTDDTKRVYDGYRVQAFDYVLKQNLERELPICMQEYVAQLEQQDTIVVKSESVTRTVAIATILYIESRSRKVLIHTEQEEIAIYGKLSDMETTVLPYGFVRIHQSYLVKKSSIEKIDGNVVIIGTRKLPISRKYYKSLQTQFNTEQKMKVASTELETTVTCSLTKRMEDHGAIIGTKGELLGIIYRMKKGECLKLGRNAGSCQLTLKKSNISREHCVVRRLTDGNYEVEDCSKNGVYVEGSYLGRGKTVQAEAGNRVWLCDESQEFRLG